MNETSTIPFSDLVFVSPKATTSAAAAVPPAAAAPFSLPTLQGVASAPAGLATAGSALSFDAEVDAFMAWLARHDAVGVFDKNSSTFRVAASSAIHSPVSTTSIPTT